MKKRRGTEQGYTPYSGSKKMKKEIKKISFLLDKKDDLTATNRQELERKLRALTLQLTELEQGRRAAKLKDKYKYVRFVEQKKAARKLNQIKRDISALTPSSPEYARKSLELRRYEIAKTYISAFPQDAKYVALFPAGQEAEVQDMSHSDVARDTKLKKTDLIRMRVWDLCKVAVEEGRGDTLVLHTRDLKDNKSEDSADVTDLESLEPPAPSFSGNQKDTKFKKKKSSSILDSQKGPLPQPMEIADDFFLSADTENPVSFSDHTGEVEAKEVVKKLSQNNVSPEPPLQKKHKKSKVDDDSRLSSAVVKERKKKVKQ
ncbi:hypothetical protein SeLEV6574_g05319 [Synchytrium endobioticum]|nr:hypothetical protein SeLEV6574_g05319 [Synchytrium endobioticum]